MLKRIFDPEPVICFICRRAARGIGYTPPKGRNQPIAWVCDDPTCNKVLKDAYHMPVRELSQKEAFSLAEAGDHAGEYLATIGKTDLAELSREEWLRFLKVILTSYGTGMRDRLLPKTAGQ